MTDAINRLAALAQESRLAVFRFLVTCGPRGAAAGEIASEFGLPGATLNFHLDQLVQAGLVQRQRQGRSMIYSAVYPAMNELMAFLERDCCARDPEACK